MEAKHIKLIDVEEKQRIGEIIEKFNNREKIDFHSVFKHARISKLLQNNEDIVIHNYGQNDIVYSLLIHSSIFLYVYPDSDCVINPDLLKPFLETGVIFPVLLRDYSTYPSKFILEVIKHPHISVDEFFAYRGMRLFELSGEIVCSHCVKKVQDQCMEEINKIGYVKEVAFTTNVIFTNISPYCHPDTELLHRTLSAIKRKDNKEFEQIYGYSFSLRNVRTAQAYQSALYIPEKYIEESTKLMSYEKMGLKDPSIKEKSEICLEGIGLVQPGHTEITKYLEIIMSNRTEIRTVLDDIMNRSKSGTGTVTTQLLVENIAKVNDEIRRIEKGTRYIVLKDISILLSNNKSILASMFVAGAMGITGNYYACGTAVAAGVISKAVEKTAKIKIDGKIKEDIDKAIKKKLEPSIKKLLSIYLGTDTLNVGIWRMRKEMKSLDTGTTKKAGKPGKSPIIDVPAKKKSSKKHS